MGGTGATEFRERRFEAERTIIWACMPEMPSINR